MRRLVTVALIAESGIACEYRSEPEYPQEHMFRDIHPELELDGFTDNDGTVRFYGFVRALMLRQSAKTVLDLGAGRGAAFHDDKSVFRKYLRDLRIGGATVVACDIDDAVLAHPASDKRVVCEIGEPLPFKDNSFDIIVSDMTFEHVDDVSQFCSELLRVVKPGGYICARTPNRHSYVKLAARLVPNRLHAKTLGRIQPGRKEEDVFPTAYKLNSKVQVEAAFPDCKVICINDSADPAYFFGSRFVYRAFLMLHKLLPARFSTSLLFFIRKPSPISESHHEP